MSHLATITLNLDELEKEQLHNICDENIKIIQNAIDSNKYQNNELLKKSIIELKNIKESIVESVQFLSGSYEAKQYSEKGFFRTQYDKIEKLTLNVIQAIDYTTKTESSINNFEYYVYEYGQIATKALEQIYEHNLEVNENVLSDLINELVSIKADPSELKVFKEKYYKHIYQHDDQNVQSYFLSRIHQVTTKKDITDYELWYKEQIKKLINNNQIIKPFADFLVKNKQYQFQGQRVIVESKGLASYYIFENKIGEQIEFTVSADNTVSYKIGDYASHVCTKTAKEMLAYIENHSKMKVLKQNIIREFVASKPKYKAKEKIKQWGK
ncbi:hypothetical protein JM47_02980 [Ureaplasma diversum]|uniref:Uncharacterized protein n=1 Tax=Ureaplasma diversum TaxID=42094 RepID=A0A0C5RLF2_9BACT|nr:hypothetical protein [Ureaplasma diversum]AJQ45508.1 hypothetical protein JM47_02980 [Ureaplasma diversum]